MRGINKVILIGNLGNEPETNFTAAGVAITRVSIATSIQWKDKNTGENKDQTEWHRIVFFNRLAEVAGQYLKKGSKVYIEGSLRTNKWQDKDGIDRFTTEIIAGEMQMLDGRGEAAADHQPSQRQNAPAQQQAMPAGNDFDDDIPF